ncbi:class 1 fructose-bisphosphatase [Paracoccus nototheniae]|uniref:Fructose-1,6-bisphosphatase class 1 n=1 Tax=Paracoccus nototheniae TaxID=2489002 RepID=A0ABW4DUE2_9RHOB|nr:class 1 fructose-bisphosphatase [Paracoccus nototheniae]
MTTAHLETRLIADRFRPVLTGLANGAVALADRIRRGGVDAGPPPPDQAADGLFATALQDADLRWMTSSRQPQIRAMQAEGTLALALDPLDGAAGLETNAPVGTIFAIFPAEDTPEASFLRPARQMLAAGYVLYGPRCCLVLSFGKGTQIYGLDPESQRFMLVRDGVTLPAASPEFAIDASDYRHWSRPVRAYIDDCLAGTEGPRAHDFNMRWIGALAAEAHRILTRGGIFLDPANGRPGAERGRLRMLHQAAPVAFLIEQAGGRATDGALPVLDAPITALDARSPLIFGSADKVDRVASYHDLPEAEVSALFGHRGLFRA